MAVDGLGFGGKVLGFRVWFEGLGFTVLGVRKMWGSFGAFWVYLEGRGGLGAEVNKLE